jgi:Holliday junction resolvase RusA-like endonuclease
MRHDAAILKMAEERGGKILKAQYAIADRERPGIQLISQSTDGRSAPHVSVLVIPDFTPFSLNAYMRGTIRRRCRIEARTRAIVQMAMATQAIPRATTARRVSLEVTFKGNEKRPDPGNLRKCFEDALVSVGLLMDDCFEMVAWTDPVYRIGTRRETRVVLEDIPRRVIERVQP